MMASLCNKHKVQEDKGTLVVEIRHLQSSSTSNDIFSTYEDQECSICSVHSVNAFTEKANGNEVSCDYFNPPQVYNVIIQRPSNHQELHKLLSVVLPRNCGPALLERRDGSVVSPESCNTFQNGEKIIFREIRPPSTKDFDMKEMYHKCKDMDIEHYESLLTRLLSK